MGYRVLEEVLLKHPDVIEVCAIAVPKPSKMREAKIFVVLRENSMVKPEELMNFLREKVNGLSERVEIEIIDELPKSPSGMVLRKELVSRC